MFKVEEIRCLRAERDSPIETAKLMIAFERIARAMSLYRQRIMECNAHVEELT